MATGGGDAGISLFAFHRLKLWRATRHLFPSHCGCFTRPTTLPRDASESFESLTSSFFRLRSRLAQERWRRYWAATTTTMTTTTTCQIIDSDPRRRRAHLQGQRDRQLVYVSVLSTDSVLRMSNAILFEVEAGLPFLAFLVAPVSVVFGAPPRERNTGGYHVCQIHIVPLFAHRRLARESVL